MTTGELTWTVGFCLFPLVGTGGGAYLVLGTKDSAPRLLPKGRPAAGHSVWQPGIRCRAYSGSPTPDHCNSTRSIMAAWVENMAKTGILCGCNPRLSPIIPNFSRVELDTPAQKVTTHCWERGNFYPRCSPLPSTVSTHRRTSMSETWR